MKKVIYSFFKSKLILLWFLFLNNQRLLEQNLYNKSQANETSNVFLLI